MRCRSGSIGLGAVYAEAMSLSPALLEILACPEDKGPLFYLEAESVLYNPRLTRSYEIRDDIPVMLIDEATTVDQAEHDRLMTIVEESSIAATFDADTPQAGSARTAQIAIPRMPNRARIDLSLTCFALS